MSDTGSWNRKTLLLVVHAYPSSTFDSSSPLPHPSWLMAPFLWPVSCSHLQLLCKSPKLINSSMKYTQFLEKLGPLGRKKRPLVKPCWQDLLATHLCCFFKLDILTKYLDVFADKSMIHASIDAHVCGMLVWKLMMAGKIEIYTCICKSFFLDILLMGGVCIYCGLNMCTRLHTWLLQGVHII